VSIRQSGLKKTEAFPSTYPSERRTRVRAAVSAFPVKLTPLCEILDARAQAKSSVPAYIEQALAGSDPELRL
jgi:hypothetical protein